MTRYPFAVACLMLGDTVAHAQSDRVAPTIAPAPTSEEMKQARPPRARGISAQLAVEAATQANDVCLRNGYKTTALVTDSAGVPIVLLANDGAAAITQRVAMSKISAVLTYRKTSGEVSDNAAKDPALAAQIKGNPLIETARQGAIPIISGTTIVGALAVSGAPGGDKDEVCARAGLAKIQERVS